MPNREKLNEAPKQMLNKSKSKLLAKQRRMNKSGKPAIPVTEDIWQKLCKNLRLDSEMLNSKRLQFLFWTQRRKGSSGSLKKCICCFLWVYEVWCVTEKPSSSGSRQILLKSFLKKLCWCLLELFQTISQAETICALYSFTYLIGI